MAQTVDFRGIPICRAGEWNGLTGKAVVTREDLQAVVDAYQDGEVDKARVKLGHVSSLNDQALGDGAPAFGWVSNPLSLIHISEPTRLSLVSRMPSSA